MVMGTVQIVGNGIVAVFGNVVQGWRVINTGPSGRCGTHRLYGQGVPTVF